jgi:DNA-binding transcriptional ArsR family regulator
MVKYEAAGLASDQLDAVFTALAHPARRSMLARLGRGEATVGELAEPLAISLPAVTKHLKVLERAQLIQRGRQAQWRPCRLQVQPLQAASGWLEAQRAVWEARLDRLEAYLHHMQAQAGSAESAPPAARPPDKTPTPRKGHRRG